MPTEWHARRALTSLERFLRYCRFDPRTGCVLWTGGTTAGRGKTARYGAFKDGGRRWAAHRWAAAHIHGLAIDEMHVDHCCDPHRAGDELLPPNTLCVRHLQAVPGGINVDLRWERQRWLFVQKGMQDAPPLFDELAVPRDALPLHRPPAWLRLDSGVNMADEDCPF